MVGVKVLSFLSFISGDVLLPIINLFAYVVINFTVGPGAVASRVRLGNGFGRGGFCGIVVG